MVCVPCFIIPVLLYVWHRFIQPYVLRYWNPWAKKDADGKVIQGTDDQTKFPFDCSGGKCTFLSKGKKTEVTNETATGIDGEIVQTTEAVRPNVDKKLD